MMLTGWFLENIVELFGAVTGIAYVLLEIRRNILLWPLGIITSAVYIYVFCHNGLYANMGLQGYYLVISIYGWHAWHTRSEATQSRESGRAHGTQVAKRRSPATAGEHRDQAEGADRQRSVSGAGLSAQAEGADRQRSVSGSGLRPKALTDKGASVAQDSEHRPKALTDKGASVAQRLESGTDVATIGRKTALLCLLTALMLWGLLWFLLNRHTDSPVPMWDGLITSLSVVATWMLTKRYLEQWYIWIVANAIAVILYLVMGLYPTAMLFLVYFGMAIIGVWKWTRDQAIEGRALRNDPVDHFSEAARLQGRQ